MNRLTYKISLFGIKLWWNSWWGLAIIHATFDRYKNSDLFLERVKHFSSIGASRMFSWKEFKYFRRKVLKDKLLMFTILLKPVMMKKRFENKNNVIKKYVDFRESPSSNG